MDWLTKIMISILAVFAPVQAVILSVGVLIFFDLFTGMYAAHKRGEPISSSAMRRTVSKMFIYQVAVISGFLVETYLVGGLVPATKLIGGVIGMVELTSILENCNDISGKSLFKEVLKKLGSKNDTQGK